MTDPTVFVFLAVAMVAGLRLVGWSVAGAVSRDSAGRCCCKS